MAPGARSLPAGAAFVARETADGDLRVLAVLLSVGSQAMDLQRQTRGWLRLSVRHLGSGAWRSSVTWVITEGDRLRQLPVLSFEAPLPGWSLASVGGRWFVGLGHPPDQPELRRGLCRPADRLSGSVLVLQRTGTRIDNAADRRHS